MSVYKDYDFTSHSVEVEGHLMHYVDEGSGETLLFLHGNPTWSYLYRHMIGALKDRYRCIAPDHLGFGFSDKPANADYSMRAHVMRLGTFVEKLGLKDVTLVVQDWGGIIGLSWAVRHKSLIKRLVILNTTGFLPDIPGGFAEMRPLPTGLLILWALKIPVFGEVFVQGFNGFARFLVPYGIVHKERLNKEAMRGYLDPYSTWGSRRAHLESVRQVPLLPTHPTAKLLRETGAELGGWEVPTQLIWGMKDPVFVPWFLEEFERRLPNHAPSLRIPDASHFLQDDRPDLIIDKIEEFLASYPTGDEITAEPTLEATA